MDSRSPSNAIHSNRSSIKRFSFETASNDDHANNSNSTTNNSKYRLRPRRHSDQPSESHSPNGSYTPPEDLNSDESNGSPFNQFVTTSMDIPEFDPELLQPEYMSQNLFEDNDSESPNSEQRDDCEIVNIVQTGSSNSPVTVDDITRFNMISAQNGSTSDPILVDDSLNTSTEIQIHDTNTVDTNGNDSSTSNTRNSLAQNGDSVPSTTDLFNTPNNSITVSDTRDQDSDDCIMGPIRWGIKRQLQFPLDYYRPNRNFSNTYKFLDVETPSDLNTLDDIEFLFKCPICYSTITRLRSGKVPNDNDKVIYSTKCGHLFCYECIESVKSRKECSICRKPVRDKNHYHVVFP